MSVKKRGNRAPETSPRRLQTPATQRQGQEGGLQGSALGKTAAQKALEGSLVVPFIFILPTAERVFLDRNKKVPSMYYAFRRHLHMCTTIVNEMSIL